MDSPDIVKAALRRLLLRNAKDNTGTARIPPDFFRILLMQASLVLIHDAFAAAADPGMSAALRSVGFLDVLSSLPSESSRRAPRSQARLHRPATNLHE
ncbi:MAG: hypothetical protein JXA73_25440 [Acidobacteria bacterium]|nr:hypothetical protein [Acidobacteriota bacterium]